MTELHKAVRRRSVLPYDHHGRRVVVMLEPGDVVAMKYERTRKWFRAPINRVFQQLIVWNVAAERAERKAKRKAMR